MSPKRANLADRPIHHFEIRAGAAGKGNPFPKLSSRRTNFGKTRRARQLPNTSRRQGCSTLFTVFHIAEGFEAAERGGVAILGDGVGLIEAQDIVGEAADSGEDARIAADARCVHPPD